MDEEENKILLEKIETIIGYTLPNEFKKICLDMKKIDKFEIMDLESIYNEVVNSLDNENEENLYTSEPINSILPKAFDKKRVPFVSDYAGNYLGIDYNPGKEGVIGQIINYGTDEYEMRVYSYSFKEFIKNILKLDIGNDIFIMDYLKYNNISFLKEKKKDDSIKILTTKNIKDTIKQEITENIVHEETKFVIFKNEYLKNIIDILTKMNNDIINQPNVIKFKNYWFNCRIINKKDSLSRTMANEKCFYEKLNSYNHDEIKGFSFAITNYFEELKDNKILIGEERIFVEIDILKNNVLIRYTETIGNNCMKNAYDIMKEFFDNKK